MQEYSFTLRNEKKDLYNLFGRLIIFINIVLFVYRALAGSENRIQYAGIPSIVFLILAFITQYFLRNTRYRFGLHPYFFIITIAWLSDGVYWIAVTAIVFDLLHTLATFLPIVKIDEQLVTYPSFPRKKIRWPMLNNIILKDGLLTIDLKNNKLIQQYLDEKSPVVNEKEFNDFCKKQLNK